jgi:hypothetical protein
MDGDRIRRHGNITGVPVIRPELIIAFTKKKPLQQAGAFCYCNCL